MIIEIEKVESIGLNNWIVKPIGFGSSEISALYMRSRMMGGFYSERWGSFVFYNRSNAERFNKMKIICA